MRGKAIIALSLAVSMLLSNCNVVFAEDSGETENGEMIRECSQIVEKATIVPINSLGVPLQEGEYEKLPEGYLFPEGQSALNEYEFTLAGNEATNAEAVLSGETGNSSEGELPFFLNADLTELSFSEGKLKGNLKATVGCHSISGIEATVIFGIYTSDSRIVKSYTQTTNTRALIENIEVDGLDDGSFMRVFCLSADGNLKPLAESLKYPLSTCNKANSISIDGVIEKNMSILTGNDGALWVDMDSYLDEIGAVYEMYDTGEEYLFLIQRNNQYVYLFMGYDGMGLPVTFVEREGKKTESVLDFTAVFYNKTIFLPLIPLSTAMGMEVVDTVKDENRDIKITTNEVIRGSDLISPDYNHLKPSKLTGCVANDVAYYSMGKSKIWKFDGSSVGSLSVKGIPTSMLVNKNCLYYSDAMSIYRLNLKTNTEEKLFTADKGVKSLVISNGNLIFKDAKSDTDEGSIYSYNPDSGVLQYLCTADEFDVFHNVLYAVKVIISSGEPTFKLKFINVDIQSGELIKEETISTELDDKSNIYVAKALKVVKSEDGVYVRVYVTHAYRSNVAFDNVYLCKKNDSEKLSALDYDTFKIIKSDSYLESTANLTTDRLYSRNYGTIQPFSTTIVYYGLKMLNLVTLESQILLQGSASYTTNSNGYHNFFVYSYYFLCENDNLHLFVRVFENFYLPGNDGITKVTIVTPNSKGELVSVGDSQINNN